jgi:hypothetical protein
LAVCTAIVVGVGERGRSAGPCKRPLSEQELRELTGSSMDTFCLLNVFCSQTSTTDCNVFRDGDTKCAKAAQRCRLNVAGWAGPEECTPVNGGGAYCSLPASRNVICSWEYFPCRCKLTNAQLVCSLGGVFATGCQQLVTSPDCSFEDCPP